MVLSLRRLPFAGRLAGGVVLCLAAVAPAQADKIKHPTAVFSGLDKITGRIISFEVGTDETVQFGSLQITERVCYTRPPTETPQTDSFVEVDEVDAENHYKRIFSGWMYAASPGLHGIEHPVYDVWLTDCKGGTEVIPSPPETASAEPPPPPENAQPTPQPKPKPPRRAQPDDTLGATRGPIEVPPPVGAERRAPTQRFFPTTSTPMRDPAGNGGF